jgi:hypothetical protein
MHLRVLSLGSYVGRSVSPRCTRDMSEFRMVHSCSIDNAECWGGQRRRGGASQGYWVDVLSGDALGATGVCRPISKRMRTLGVALDMLGLAWNGVGKARVTRETCPSCYWGPGESTGAVAGLPASSVGRWHVEWPRSGMVWKRARGVR